MTNDYWAIYDELRRKQEEAARLAEAQRKAKAAEDAQKAQAILDWQRNQVDIENKEREKQKEEAAKQETTQGYLDINPQGVFSSFITTLDPALQNYYKDHHYDFYNRYQGSLAGQAAGGNVPQGDYLSFLKGLDLNEEYKNKTSYQKGFYKPLVAPRARMLTSY